MPLCEVGPAEDVWYTHTNAQFQASRRQAQLTTEFVQPGMPTNVATSPHSTACSAQHASRACFGAGKPHPADSVQCQGGASTLGGKQVAGAYDHVLYTSHGWCYGIQR